MPGGRLAGLGATRDFCHGLLAAIIQALARDEPLEPRHHDHALGGPWSDFRDCHVRPDLVFIYQKSDPEALRLVRIGSHAELGF